MTERWDRVTALFAAARALAPDLRARFLDLACENDHDLRADIEALLASDKDDGFLAEPPWTLIGDAIARNVDAVRGERVPEPAPLRTGAFLGPYEIQKAIGAGGMGEVYRAHDAKLNRDVALKLLPDEFIRDPDRLARFQREAWLLASLNHPNIAQIYGFEQSDGRPFLVLELVAGETLADRIARGPVPPVEAFAIAMQIVDALEVAHDQGIIHRDLKPANVKVREDGLVKVLDFGLAKTVKPVSASGADAMNSPTPSARATERGLILGTAAYMAPEQAKGKPADRRADVWAFGVVLFEMLSGQQLFAGESASEVMASVIRDDPDWTRLPPDLPEATRRLLRRCLQKDQKKRLSSIADARLELTESPDTAVNTAARGARRPSPGWMLGGVLAATALAAVAWFVIVPTLRSAPDVHPARVSVLGPAGVQLLLDPSESAISPDGRALVFTSIDPDGNTRLWLRSLDALDAHPLAGTDHGFLPFWSPDSRQIAFFAGDKLMKVSAEGGTAAVVCTAPGPRGGTWGAQGAIVFAPGNAGPLQRVSANGGEPQAVTALDATHGETGHRFPWFLPDGRHFLYAALPPHNQKYDLFVGSVDGATPEVVTSADGAAVYAAPGYLVFPRQNALVAQRFDASRRKLLDEPIVIGQAPAALGALYSASRAVSVSATGALAYLSDRLPNTKLEWFARSGGAVGSLAVPDGRYKEFAFAPDGRHVSVVRYTSASESDIWLVDLSRGGFTRFTYGPGVNVSSAWSPDSTRIVFDSDRNGTRDLFVKAAAGATPEQPLFTSPALFKYSRSWSPDGKWIVFDQLDPETNRDLWILPVEGDRTPKPYLRTPFTEGWGQVSPDGRWMAYYSTESGRPEIYVDAFPTPRNKFRVSNDGALSATWRKDGKELAILSLDSRSMLVADVVAGAEFRAGTPRLLVPLPQGIVYALPTPDFQRVLVARPIEENTTSSLTLVFGWAGALKKH